MASYYLRGNTYWICYYKDGQKVQKSLKTKDKAIARFKANEIENDLAKGLSPIPNHTVNINKAISDYEAYAKNLKSKTSMDGDISRIKRFIAWANINRLSSITESILRKYLNHRIDEDEITISTVNHTIKSVKILLNYAVKEGYLSENPLKNMRKYKIEKKPPRFLTKDEIKALFEASKDSHLYPMIACAIYTGMRKSELLRLKWTDIDLSKGVITVSVSKSKNFRVVPIHNDLKSILSNKTVPFNHDVMRNEFWRIQEKCKLKDIGWHTFRHTFASHLVMNGVDLVTVGKLLGHSNISTTMIYSHLTEGHIYESIKKLSV